MHPTIDWNGRAIRGVPRTPLAGGWCGQLCQIRGDWQFYCECFYFPQWNSADQMCWLCRASSVDAGRLWTDFSRNAGWRETMWTHESYLHYRRTSGLAIPMLLRNGIGIIGLRLECVMVDVLHTIDLGLACHIIANVMFIIAVLRNVFGGATYAERVKNLARHMHEWYKKTKCTSKLQGKLTLERTRTSNNWPKLKANAAATRHLAEYALHLMEEFGRGDAYDNDMATVCKLLVRFYELLKTETMFVSANAKKEFPVLAQALTGIYQRLASSAFEHGQTLWKLSPKMHLFVHLCEVQAVLNPRFFWTYGDEDLVGQIIDIAATCHPWTLPFTVLFKWCHASGLFN